MIAFHKTDSTKGTTGGAKMSQTIEQIIERYEDTDLYIAIRCDDRQLDVGYEFGYSLHNPNREDLRDFSDPDDPDTYELDGTSCYNIETMGDLPEPENCLFGHCYVVLGDDKGVHEDPDEDEILLQGCRIVEQIF
jgi:hypothetical protein